MRRKFPPVIRIIAVTASLSVKSSNCKLIPNCFHRYSRMRRAYSSFNNRNWWTKPTHYCTVTVTFTITELDPSVKVTCPVYVPVAKFVISTVILTLSDAPLPKVSLVGLFVSQFPPSVVDGDADHVPVSPQLLIITV